jgi:RimJ/RimL family protein N-acetyltransferase
MEISEKPSPAYKVVTPRLILRVLEPRDAVALHQLTEDNVGHLEHMIWSKHATLNESLNRYRTSRSNFDRDDGYSYLVFLRQKDDSEGLLIGSGGIYLRGILPYFLLPVIIRSIRER